MNIFNLARKYFELRKDLDAFMVSEVEFRSVAMKQVVELEKAMTEMQSSHDAEIRELRERLDMGARKRPSGRPFPLLRKLAEMGEQKLAAKENNHA